MPNENQSEVDAFVRERIDSIPHLEALLLLWNERPRLRTLDEMAGALFLDTSHALVILRELVRDGLLTEEEGSPARFRYASPSPERDRLIALVEVTYRRELIRVTGMIHSKGSAAARAFARAFRFKKDKEQE